MNPTVLTISVLFRLAVATPIFGGTVVKDTSSHLSQAICSLQRNQLHICGCILVRENWVLTAAHCFPERQHPFNISDYTVVIGKNDLRVISEKDHDFLARIVIHGNFISGNQANDIALLKLFSKHHSKPFPIVTSINDIKSWKCTVIGYGSNSSYSDSSLKLYQGSTNIIPYGECLDLIGRIMLAPSGTCCTKNDGTNPCGGDSGGPLICSGVLLGLVSHGPQCHLYGMATVYTHLLEYLNWISDVLLIYK